MVMNENATLFEIHAYVQQQVYWNNSTVFCTQRKKRIKGLGSWFFKFIFLKDQSHKFIFYD